MFLGNQDHSAVDVFPAHQRFPVLSSLHPQQPRLLDRLGREIRRVPVICQSVNPDDVEGRELQVESLLSTANQDFAFNDQVELVRGLISMVNCVHLRIRILNSTHFNITEEGLFTAWLGIGLTRSAEDQPVRLHHLLALLSTAVGNLPLWACFHLVLLEESIVISKAFLRTNSFVAAQFFVEVNERHGIRVSIQVNDLAFLNQVLEHLLLQLLRAK